MELLVAAALVAAAVLGIAALVFAYLIIKLITKEQVKLVEKQEIDNKDNITPYGPQPSDEPDGTVSLTDFTPDFAKPIKMVTNVDDEGNEVTEIRQTDA